uniref:LrgA family protein n=2 Tax=Pseudoalteromonas citrea TaxID=43655 RepID=U1KMD9_9GAMM
MLSCLYSAKFIVAAFNLTIPAPLLGMLFLISLLYFKIVLPPLIAPAALPILKYMALFFVPAGVGILQYTTLLLNNLDLLVSILILVPTVGLMCVGLIANRGKYSD